MQLLETHLIFIFSENDEETWRNRFGKTHLPELREQHVVFDSWNAEASFEEILPGKGSGLDLGCMVVPYSPQNRTVIYH